MEQRREVCVFEKYLFWTNAVSACPRIRLTTLLSHLTLCFFSNVPSGYKQPLFSCLPAQETFCIWTCFTNIMSSNTFQFYNLIVFICYLFIFGWKGLVFVDISLICFSLKANVSYKCDDYFSFLYLGVDPLKFVFGYNYIFWF